MFLAGVFKNITERIFFMEIKPNVQTAPLTQFEKIAKEAATAKKVDTNKEKIEVKAIKLVPKPTEHFPYKRDELGNKVKDDRGRFIREEKRDGYLYTMNDVDTCNKVMFLLPELKQFEIGKIYEVTGLGYMMKQSNMLYIDEDVTVQLYQ